MLRFSIPTNFQRDLIPNLTKNKNIEELYGKLSRDIVGGGRASAVLPFVSKKRLTQHILEAHKNGLKFNYLLNSTCLDNLEWSISWQRTFRKLLDYLVKIGVDRVTIGIPYLLEVIKKKYPELEVCVSVQTGIKSLPQAKFWENLGADEVTLFMDINRNFPLLSNTRKEINCKLKLIANLACLYGCPFYHYHANLQSHASQVSHPSKGFVVDYCTLRCRLIRLTRPEEFIRSRWIRPEDIKIYEELGIDTLKFVNRDMRTEAICSIIDAYTERKYEGNLLDLFSDPSKSLAGYKLDFQKARYFFKPFRVNIFKFYKARKFLGADKIYINNRDLDGFLQFFLNNNCSLISCQECNYCEETASRAINISPEYMRSHREKYKDFLDNLINGKLFRYF
ncbi:MAG: U32 family peptidase [Candidatus Omnitrophica bacterium]|nr:U32 family peptidase [Candidatus Omnitrophota bacterium]